MERTEENVAAVAQMVADFDALRFKPTDPVIAEKLATWLQDTYLNACRDMDTAKIVHRAFLRHEEEYPRPATVRKYLRQLNFVECDADMEYGV